MLRLGSESGQPRMEPNGQDWIDWRWGLGFGVDDFGHAEKLPFAIGGPIQNLVAIAVGLELVRPEDIAHVNGAGRGGHIAHVQFTELFKIIQNATKLGGKLGFFGFRQVQPREMGYLVYLVAIQHKFLLIFLTISTEVNKPQPDG